MKLKVAVVGLGIGRVHLKYYLENPEVEVVGAVDSHPDACRQVASEFKVKTFLSAEEL
ncbi:MAG TPA: Gfo/Idh/MocA family oxidoreductase, partial [bacterium]|nr:Gfo/Idh/MocA family oxidoreductase [bacterium]